MQTECAVGKVARRERVRQAVVGVVVERHVVEKGGHVQILFAEEAILFAERGQVAWLARTRRRDARAMYHELEADEVGVTARVEERQRVVDAVEELDVLVEQVEQEGVGGVGVAVALVVVDLLVEDEVDLEVQAAHGPHVRELQAKRVVERSLLLIAAAVAYVFGQCVVHVVAAASRSLAWSRIHALGVFGALVVVVHVVAHLEGIEAFASLALFVDARLLAAQPLVDVLERGTAVQTRLRRMIVVVAAFLCACGGGGVRCGKGALAHHTHVLLVVDDQIRRCMQRGVAFDRRMMVVATRRLDDELAAVARRDDGAVEEAVVEHNAAGARLRRLVDQIALVSVLVQRVAAPAAACHRRRHTDDVDASRRVEVSRGWRRALQLQLELSLFYFC